MTRLAGHTAQHLALAGSVQAHVQAIFVVAFMYIKNYNAHMNTNPSHSFVQLRGAMLTLAAWLETPLAHTVGQIDANDGAHRLRSLCSAGLRNLAGHAEEFDQLIARPNAFATHFSATVAMLARTAAGAEDAAAPPAAPSDAQLADAAFMLVEDMAALFRERSLRAPETPVPSAEEALLAHFEHCGEWHPADGATVTDWYYVRLPALVLAQLLRRTEAAARAASAACPPGS